MNKYINIRVSGGFHNAGTMTVRATVTVSRDGKYWIAELNERQCIKIWRHLCGMTDCKCGGGYGDEWDVPNGWERDSKVTWFKPKVTAQAEGCQS